MKRTVPDCASSLGDIVRFETVLRTENLSKICDSYKTINVPKSITTFTNIVANNPHVFVWLLSEGFHSSTETASYVFSSLISGGNLGIMKQIHRLTIIPKTNTEFVTSACSAGQVHVLKWLLDNDFSADPDVGHEAMDNRHYHIFQILWERDIKPDDCEELFTTPAEDGNIEFFEWAKNHNYYWEYYNTTRIGEIGASMGHLDLVQWAEANGCPLHRFTCLAAFNRKQYEICKWLIDKGYHK